MHKRGKMGSVIGFALMLTSCVQAQAEKNDNERLQGTWVVVSSERMGSKGKGFRNATKVTFAGDRFTMEGGIEVKGVFTVDLTKTPKHLDARADDGVAVSQGIFILEHDVLRWCFASSDSKNRPTEFTTRKDKDHMLLVLERAKQ